MKRNPRRISPALLLCLLALVSLLLAPAASLAHLSSAGAPAVAATSDNGGCHGHNSDQQQHDNCQQSACSCACHAPLFSSVTLPLPAAVPLVFAVANLPHLPQVYLPIYVPPQNQPSNRQLS